MYNNLLLVADDLEQARSAAQMVGETARRMRSAHLYIAVAYSPVPDFLGTPYSEQAGAARVAKAEAVAEGLRREIGAIPGEVHVELLAGTLAGVTRAISQVRGSDLIVMAEASRPARRWWAGLLGRDLADPALCPVMIVG